MKRVFRLAPMVLVAAGIVLGQDSSMPPDDGSGALPRFPGAYASDGYRQPAELFVSGFGSTSSEAVGNSVIHNATNAGGFSAGYRFHLNGSSALEGRYGYSKNSQTYNVFGDISSIGAYLAEITGSYVHSLPAIRRIRPFVEGAGGVIYFRPADYGSGQPYSTWSAPAAGGAYTGSTPGVGSQTRPAIVYGAGFDLPIHSRLSARVEYRGWGYKTPDFTLPTLRTDVFGFVSEPSWALHIASRGGFR